MLNIRRASFILVCLVAAITALVCFLMRRSNPPTDAGYRILRAIRDGQIVPDSKGVALIPPTMGLGPVRKAYVTKLHDGGLLVLVPLWQGHDSNLTGTLYSSRPLTRAEIISDYDRPAVYVMVGDRIQAELGAPVRVYIDRQISPTQFAVSRGDD